jgi:2',3'-cyclic-nucleotide 2'-phosphodiesterase (5'-nucleotidase family)
MQTESGTGDSARSATGQGVAVADELSTRNVRTEESNLANVVADALRAVAESDMALIAATSFSDVTLPKGNVTADDVLRALVFRGDTVVVMRLTGAQIRRALEHGLGLYPARSAAFLQVSGLSIVVDPSADRGSRVLSVKVGKEPMSDTRTYTVAMPSPLAGGALVYSKAWSRDDMERDTRKTLEQAIRAYLATGPSLSAKTGDRIAFKR